MTIKVVGTRQLRDELASVMEELSRVSAVVVTHHGEGRAVLLELARYNDLVDRLEYLEDSLDALATPRAGAIPLEELE